VAVDGAGAEPQDPDATLVGMSRSSPAYLRPYLAAASEHGGAFEAQLWRSREAQRRRFEVLVEMAGAARFDGGRVVDLGCGTGGFATFLEARGLSVAAGFGVEAVPELAATARRDAPPNWAVETFDFVADPARVAELRPDVAVLSGSLNTLPERQARRTLAAIFEQVAVGVCFNFLSDRHHRTAPEDLAPARRFSTLAMIRFATGLTPRVAFRQDHLDGHDAAIWMERAEAPRAASDAAPRS
jgi:SAM-dependent methyltransferase